MSKRNSIIWSMLDNEEFVKLVQNSSTYKEILQRFGLKNKGNNHKTLKSRIKELNIVTDHLKPNYFEINKITEKKKIPLSEILICNSKYNRSHLKKRLIKEGLLKEKCSICNLDKIWNNKPIVMILDHINGNSEDNRLENLRMICPNCNSQTSTFAGKNYNHHKEKTFCSICGKEKKTKYSDVCLDCLGLSKRKVERPDKESLQKMISELSWCAIGRKYGVSNNAVKKWAKQYGLLTENQIKSGYGSEKKTN